MSKDSSGTSHSGTWHVLAVGNNYSIRIQGIYFTLNDFFFTDPLKTEYLSTSAASQVEEIDFLCSP